MSPRALKFKRLQVNTKLTYSHCPVCGDGIHLFYAPENSVDTEYYTCQKHVLRLRLREYGDEQMPFMGYLTPLYAREIPADVQHAIRMYQRDFE